MHEEEKRSGPGGVEGVYAVGVENACKCDLLVIPIGVVIAVLL